MSTVAAAPETYRFTEHPFWCDPANCCEGEPHLEDLAHESANVGSVVLTMEGGAVSRTGEVHPTTVDVVVRQVLGHAEHVVLDISDTAAYRLTSREASLLAAALSAAADMIEDREC